MAAVSTRVESCFTYQVRTSDPCYPTWSFTIVVNQDGSLGTEDIKTPKGWICDSGTQIPNEVLNAIIEARAEVENILTQSSAVNGTLAFVDQTSQAIVFATPFANPEYRVYVTLDDFIDWKISNQTHTGFEIVLNVTYTGDVKYDVLV